MIQVQLVRPGGVDLAGPEPCPRCGEAITPADGSFVALRLTGREAVRLHLDCYEVLVVGLRAFRDEVVRQAPPEAVN